MTIADPISTDPVGDNRPAMPLTNPRTGPAYRRAVQLIDRMDAEAGPGRILHGALQAAIIAKANDIDTETIQEGLRR
jgi:hypothetical protein